ncbi:FAD-binding protein [Haloechinothrix sp. YIM 98757]|uniref:FAD-binding protein n=1 Tax=Haloechinothrix aidingensis TaxID=2752311 RepID=A0A838A9G2_9PSEU|nr:FAD-binding protein [Haloechinothrix aidingensis]
MSSTPVRHSRKRGDPGAATVPGHGLTGVPALDGALTVDAADLARVARDFGNQVHRVPRAVLLPGSAADIASIVRYGRERGIPVVPRGEGHSVHGQTQVRDGIVVDMPALSRIRAVGPDRVHADAGARWGAVLDAALRDGTAPPVLPDYLALSVGGTLSVGGIGGASHQYGYQADNVRDLDVVTPRGDLVTCSPHRNGDLFDAVRGSQGRHGIITRATVDLVPARRSARRHLLSYADLRVFLADQCLLAGQGRFNHVTGWARYASGVGWRYVLEAVSFYDPPEEPDPDVLLRGLGHERGAEEIATTGYRDFLLRYTPVEVDSREPDPWQQHAHPRCNVLLPGRYAEALISGVLDDLAPDDLGPGGGVLIYPIPTARLAAPNVPRVRDAVTVVFGVQRAAPSDDHATIERMQRANADLYAAARRIGGVGYSGLTAHHEALYGAHPRFSEIVDRPSNVREYRNEMNC